jgi:UDP-N-acetylmuramate--alanine ligase
MTAAQRSGSLPASAGAAPVAGPAAGAGAELDLLAHARRGPVHFTGICGAGMSALAELVLRRGGQVTGCDAHLGEAGELLERLGARLEHGHAAAHLEGVTAVVTTPAIPAQHPELAAARERGIPVLKRAQALGALVNRGRVAAVAGTHGKTTTTAMLTAVLDHAGLDPTGFVGGRVPGWGSGLRAGGDETFVVEADEFDRSFLWLRPLVAIVTTVEADHLDIYGSAEAVDDAFVEFLGHVPGAGVVAACRDDAGVRRVLERLASAGAAAPVRTYGLEPGSGTRAVALEPLGLGTRFVIEEAGKAVATVQLSIPGLHNVRNALGAFVAARGLGVPATLAAAGLATFGGVARRFDELGHAGGITVVDDYAHHPTEVEATLRAARSAYAGRRIVAAFQPHLYSRTRDFAGRFGEALATADVIWIADVYPAREDPIPGVNGMMVVRATEAAGAAEVRFAPTLDDLVAGLAAELRAGDVCVAMGAGDVTSAARTLLRRLGGAS